MRGQLRRARRQPAVAEEGQALVEFALVLPIMLLLIFGMIQIGLVLHARQTVAYAAQVAAATYAQTLALDRAGAEAVFITAPLRPRLAPGDVSYVLHPASGAESKITSDGIGRVGDFVIARVAYRFPSPVGASFAGFRFPDTITISMDGVARIEKQGKAATGGSSSSATTGCYYAFYQFAKGMVFVPPPADVLAGYQINGAVGKLENERAVVIAPAGRDIAYTTPLGSGTLRPSDIEARSSGFHELVASGVGVGRAPGEWNVGLFAQWLLDPRVCGQ